MTAIPDVPTMSDAGIKGWFPQTWWAMSAPKGTAAAVVKRLNAEVARAMQSQDVQEKFANLGLTPLHSTPERIHELVKTAMPRMGQAIKGAGIQPE